MKMIPARRDLKEAVWRTYKNLVLLGKDNSLKRVDLGLIHSSAAPDILSLILGRLRSDGDLESGISPNFLVRNWPPAFKEWSTKSVRDAFFAAPQFPRLTSADVLKETISRGVGNGVFAYVGKLPSGEYKPFWFGQALMTTDVELSDEIFLVTKETADAYLRQRTSAQPQTATVPHSAVQPVSAPVKPEPTNPALTAGSNASQGVDVTSVGWSGDIPSQKWMNFYTKVLSKFASVRGLKLTVRFEVVPDGGLSQQKIEETKTALRELGLSDEVEIKSAKR